MNIIRNRINGVVLLLGATMLIAAGCQRESLIPELGTPYDGIVKFAPAVTGIGSGSAVGVRSGLSDGSAVIGSESLTLSSADGRFTIPMSLSTTGADAEGVKSLAGTRATLINDPGSEVGEIKPLVGEFAALTDNTFWVAAWDMPDDDDPSQCIPDADAKTFTGYVSGDEDNGFYQKVMYRTKDAEGEDLETPYWMTVQPGSAAPADYEYKWKKNEAQKAFYAYANVPASATMAQLPDEGTLKQTLTLTELPDADILMGYYEGDGSTGEPEKQTGTAKIKFHHPFAAVKFKAGTLASGVTITGVAIEKIYGKVGEGDAGKLMVTQEGHSFTWTRADGAAFKDANLLPEVSAACDGDAVLVIPQSLPSKARIRVTLQKGDQTFNVYTPLTGSWSNGIVYTYTIGYAPGLLPGKFSVSETEYVQFSRGNLFCTRTGEEGSYTYEFDLERNQYDFRTRPGNYAVKNGVPMATGSDESGLFQYDLSCAVNGGDFGAFGMKYPIAGDPSQILNFGKAIGPEWSTLTQSQWVYFLTKHASVWCTVKGIYGYAFAPDDYDTTMQPWTTTGNELNNWEEAESAGVLFIPAAGFMQGEGVNFGIVYADGSVVEFSGYSWTSTANGTEGAYYMGFGKAEIGTYVHVNSYAFPERLVQKFFKPHDYVDLDLPSGTLWATCNVGADSPEEYGDYFQWGGVTPVTSTSINVSWVTCPGNGGNENYNESAFNTWKTENLTGYVLKPTVDAACANWGGDWRIPTSDDFKELCENTNNQWIEENGVKGWKFTSTINSGKHIFLPACGSRYDTQIYDKDSNGLYWSSSLNSSKPEEAYYLSFGSSTDILLAGRGGGCPVRPVQYVHD